ncbi:MAG: hypothetical protein N2Z74_04575 [Syntrophales bacterium]|nr:hypothetical protein [Syntrophales bacterium]
MSSLGLFLAKNQAVLVSPKGEVSLSGREFKGIADPVDFLLRVMLSTIHHYQEHLKAIKIMSAELEAKIVVSMENKYLLQMFTIGESLVYYLNALEGNATILAKLRSMAEKLNMTPNQIELLDDISIENQ